MTLFLRVTQPARYTARPCACAGVRDVDTWTRIDRRSMSGDGVRLLDRCSQVAEYIHII